ncbi:MAG TPA: hypothetical protein PLR06_03035 [Cyclobacteriaceae bacterium]|nr:hypothetical protein [Cyclobacteriaceae bacterium]
MKTKIITLLLFLLATGLQAQTQVNKTITVSPGQKIKMTFDYPKLITVTTWEKNEIQITGTVSINNGENDDSFKLDFSTKDNVVTVDSYIKDMKNLPHTVTIMEDGKKIMFRTKEDFKKYEEENGKHYTRMSWGTDIEITLDVKIPEHTETHVKSTYGMVEVKKFLGALDVEATYGGIDVAVEEKSTGELVAETNYGDIFSNLTVRFDGINGKHDNFHTLVKAHPGKGPNYTFESKYGNVYLRKSN